MSKELDEAMDSIPNLTEEQINLLIEFQLSELAKYDGKKGKAKKDQSAEDVSLALEGIIKEQSTTAKPAGKFVRRF